MTKVTYASLKLKTNSDVNVFDFCGNKIEVLKYLPIEDKNALVNITLQESMENGVCNPIRLEMFFHLNLVYMYTNITFTDKQKEDEAKLYDTLNSNGFIDLMVEKIPEEEYTELLTYINDLKEEQIRENNSILGSVRNIMKELYVQADDIQKLVDNFNKDKYKEVLDFAKAANNDKLS